MPPWWLDGDVSENGKKEKAMLTAQMQEIVNWWDQYGIRKWEIDDVDPLFKELLVRLDKLPTQEEWLYLFNYLSSRNSL
jgi:hypothetical protein